MRRIVIVLVLLGLPLHSAFADQLSDMTLANGLGNVIAAEDFCGLVYDQDAIASFIAAKVPADNLDFPPLLTGMISGADYNQQSMTASAKTAHCTQIARLAKSYGFVK